MAVEFGLWNVGGAHPNQVQFSPLGLEAELEDVLDQRSGLCDHILVGLIMPSAMSYAHRLEKISMFFDGTDAGHQTRKRVVATFHAAGVSCAIVGGMAVNAHRHRRTTKYGHLCASAVRNPFFW